MKFKITEFKKRFDSEKQRLLNIINDKSKVEEESKRTIVELRVELAKVSKQCSELEARVFELTSPTTTQVLANPDNMKYIDLLEELADTKKGSDIMEEHIGGLLKVIEEKDKTIRDLEDRIKVLRSEEVLPSDNVACQNEKVLDANSGCKDKRSSITPTGRGAGCP